MDHSFDGPCILQQDEARGEPTILLRRAPDAPVEVLTVQEAHALLVQYDHDYDDSTDYWWWELNELLEGIR
ncbi:hypothetical protein [Caudoviricetes sp.]|nr:hypothetical protein [Caudoviricetes sp.]